MNWGVLGTANIATKMFMPAIKAGPEAKLVAVASRSEEKARLVAANFQIEGIKGYEALLNRKDIDIVYIPLPNNLHFEWTIKALSKGKHVFLEKPAACTFNEVKEMVAMSREKRVALIENFHYHFHNQHQFIKNQLDNGIIGDIRCFRSSFGVPPFKDGTANIRYHKDLGGGALLDVGVYTINVCNFLFGNGFEVEGASLQPSKQYDIDWYGGALLSNKEKGIIAELAFGFDNFYQNSYEIWGSQGKITVHRAFTPKPNFEPTVTLELNGKPKKTITLPADDQYKKAIESVQTILRTNNAEWEREKILEQARLINQIQQITSVNLV